MKDTKISILEAVRLAGVSKSTVSRVISDKWRIGQPRDA